MSELALIVPELVVLDQDLGDHKNDVISQLANVVAATGRADSAEGLAGDALVREGQSPTGQPGGIGIPHCRSTHVKTTSLGFARLPKPVDFGAKDGPADLIFLIAAADGEGKEHLKLLSKLARAMARESFLTSLREAQSADEIVRIVQDVLAPKKSANAAQQTDTANGEATASAGVAGRRLVAVTSCPTGIAHTYMAAEALEQKAKDMGHELVVETQGSSGGTPLTQDQIDAADAVIFAVGVGVRDRERFAGKPGVEAGVNVGVSDPESLITKALAAADDPKGHRIAGGGGASSEESSSSGQGQSWGRRIQQALMTGVSYMIPFVAAGGLLMALGFALGGAERVADVGQDVVTQNTLFNLPSDGGLALYLGSVFFVVGSFAMPLLVPALAGYIAYALAGRPGIAPGFVGGTVAVSVGAGFIGGLAVGLIAGLIAMWIATIKVPRWLAGLMPVVIIPLVTTASVGLLMYLLLGRPLAALMTWLQDSLNSMSGTSAVLLGIILGLMMCFDLGGPVNKAAYLFATAGLTQSTEASMMIMAAVMAAGMVPPLAMALSTTVRGKLYSESERENGRSAWLLGASFISEGAIPFAAADPLRVIPSMMVGGAITGALTMALGVTLNAPHGGIFVVGSMGKPWAFVIALAAGVVVSALIVTVLKAQHHTSIAATSGDRH